jgi:hypothetical protein
MCANSTAAIPEERYCGHCQNGKVNKPVTQIENGKWIVHADHPRPQTAAVSPEFREGHALEEAIHPP